MVDKNTQIRLDFNFDNDAGFDYAWQLHFKRNHKNICIGGNLILPSTMLINEDRYEHKTIEKHLNRAGIFDLIIKIKKNYLLLLMITYKSGGGTLLAYKYIEGKWKYQYDRSFGYQWLGIEQMKIYNLQYKTNEKLKKLK